MTEFTDKLENEYVDNVKSIANLEKRNKELIRDLVKLFHDVAVGDVVKYKDNDYIVQRINLSSWGSYDRTTKPWLYACPKKKNGEWSGAERSLYRDWERVQ